MPASDNGLWITGPTYSSHFIDMICRKVNGLTLACVGAALLSTLPLQAAETNSITVADAALSAAFYADSSCLLNIDSLAQSGKTVIDVDVGDNGSRMLIHCDIDTGRRLTLLARGDALNVSQRVPLLTREQISEGSYGMIAWLTRSGAQYVDDSAPRRYVIAGNVMLKRSPPVDVAGYALHTERQAFARVSGLLEPIVKSDDRPVMELIDPEPLEIKTDNNNTSEDKPSANDESDAAPAATDADQKSNQTKQPASGS